MSLESKLNLKSETIDKLQDLLQLNIDSSNGFREAAELVDDAEIAAMFRRHAEERKRQADELQAYVELNDEKPKDEGSVRAAMHRTWMNVRSSLQDDQKAVLSEAERGEDVIKHAYESTLKETAGSAVNDVLQRQYAQVKTTHDKVRQMRDARKHR